MPSASELSTRARSRAPQTSLRRIAIVPAHNEEGAIAGAVQTGFRYAREHGFQLAVRLEGDGQHDPQELPRLLEPLLAGEADIVVGSRFAARDRHYRGPLARGPGVRL